MQLHGGYIDLITMLSRNAVPAAQTQMQTHFPKHQMHHIISHFCSALPHCILRFHNDLTDGADAFRSLRRI